MPSPVSAICLLAVTVAVRMVVCVFVLNGSKSHNLVWLCCWCELFLCVCVFVYVVIVVVLAFSGG